MNIYAAFYNNDSQSYFNFCHYDLQGILHSFINFCNYFSVIYVSLSVAFKWPLFDSCYKRI